jgi:hypothetical protein
MSFNVFEKNLGYLPAILGTGSTKSGRSLLRSMSSSHGSLSGLYCSGNQDGRQKTLKDMVSRA